MHRVIIQPTRGNNLEHALKMLENYSLQHQIIEGYIQVTEEDNGKPDPASGSEKRSSKSYGTVQRYQEFLGDGFTVTVTD